MTWEDEVKIANDRRASELPEKWRIPDDKLPQSETESVIDFPTKSGYLTDKEIEITEHNVPTLLTKIANGEYTSVQVATAYCHRAAIAHQLTNCLSCMFFDRAIEDAQLLDDYFKENGKVKGPFHGLPVSIKDQHRRKGTAAGCGFVYWSNEIDDTDSATVEYLHNLGAITYCKTTVPLAMMAIDTDTRIFGTTKCPYNRTHSAGGSSGGEGCLSALGGSPIGIGSDIGGSIRIPCANNGIYGLKCTSARYITAGQRAPMSGQSWVKSVAGPMARSLESIQYFTNIYLNNHPESVDNNCIPLGWNSNKDKVAEEKKKLAFGVVYDDGVVRLSSGVRRALDETVAKLKSQGHEVIEWKPISADIIFKCQSVFFTSDGAKNIQQAMKDEPIMDHAQGSKSLFIDRPNSETCALQTARLGVENAVFKSWQATKEYTSTGRPIDAVIAPISPQAGIQHKRPAFYHGYTCYWNVLDYPTVSFPVTSFDNEKGDGDNYNDILSTARNDVEKNVYAVWDPKSAQNGQIGLQVVTPRYHDELAVNLANLLTT